MWRGGEKTKVWGGGGGSEAIAPSNRVCDLTKQTNKKSVGEGVCVGGGGAV